MEIISGILVGILALLLVMVLRLITTFFHEMGHAIPALLFTDKKVEVYIGSYGDIKNTLRVNFGRLKMFFKINIFEWQIGLCRREGKVLARWKNVLIIIGGPIASLIISIPLIFILRSVESQSTLFFVCIIFIGAAVLDLIVNLYPSSSPMKMYDGDVAYSDGYRLLHIIKESFLPQEYFDLQNLFEAKKFDELITKGEALIEKNPTQRFPYDFIIQSFIEKKEYQKVLDVYAYLQQHLKFADSDSFIIGKMYKQLDKYEEALGFFNDFYFKNYLNPELINELAETHIALGDNQEAIKSLDAIIHSVPEYYRSYNNRAQALINIGDIEAAKKDLDFAMTIKQKDPLLFYNYGILYDKLNQKQLAIEHFEKAKELGSQKAGLDFTIENIRSEIIK